MKKAKQKSVFKRKIFFSIIIFGVVVSFILFRSVVLNKKKSLVPKFSGKIAYTKNKKLFIRDYDKQRDILISNNVETPEIFLWSPLGKYIVSLAGKQLSVFEIEDRSEIDTISICNFNKAEKIKWAGKSDTLVAKEGNNFYRCDFKGLRGSLNLSIEENNRLLDWVPVSQDRVIVLLVNEKTGISKLTSLNFINRASTEIIKEKLKIEGKDGKYLWFAEDRNFVYITGEWVNRIILDENYNVVYKNTVRVGKSIQPLGWNLSACVGGAVFYPESFFSIVDRNNYPPIVRQIRLSAPQKYSLFDKSIEIKKGMTYWELAEKIFGDGTRWKELYKYNTNREPTQLQIGSRVNVTSEEIKTFEFKEDEILTKFGTDQVFFDTKRSLQNDIVRFFVIKNGALFVYTDANTIIDQITGVDKAIWDWSSGYCNNHKYGEAIPSASDMDLGEKKCFDYMEVTQYKVAFDKVCEEDWTEKIVGNTTALENEILGLKMSISRIKTDVYPAGLPYEIENGTEYNFTDLGSGKYEYELYFKGMYESFIRSLKIVCEEYFEGRCREVIQNLRWTL